MNSKRNRIELGDMVRFLLIGGQTMIGKVEYIPTSPYDSWVIDEYYEGKRLGIVYIQQYQILRKLEG